MSSDTHSSVLGFLRSLVRVMIRDADEIIADTFITPGLTPPAQLGPTFNFDLDFLQGDTASDEWMMMNSLGNSL